MITPCVDLSNYQMDFTISNLNPAVGETITISWSPVANATRYWVSSGYQDFSGVPFNNEYVSADATSYSYQIETGKPFNVTIVPFSGNSRPTDSNLIRKTIIPSGYSGTCGDNATWTYDASTATLTISGTGSMSNYWFDENQSGYNPWYGHRTTIKKVVIGEGITYIGNYSFYDMSNLTEVVLPTTLLSTGAGAFESCKSLQSISFPNGFLDIGGYAFFNCANLTQVEVPSSLKNVYDCAFRNCNALTSVRYSGTAENFSKVYVSDSYNSSFSSAVICLINYDINRDGATNLMDVSVLFKLLCGKLSISSCDITVADVNGDGSISQRDVAALYSLVTG